MVRVQRTEAAEVYESSLPSMLFGHQNANFSLSYHDSASLSTSPLRQARLDWIRPHLQEDR